MRIILCDDDTVFTQVFEKRLLTVFKKYGITPEIVSAHTGVEALREITRRPTDVLFLDIDMPEKDGFSVAEELSAMPSKPLIIFLSGMEDLVYQSFAFQPFWFLRKTHLEELPQVIEKMLQILNSRQIHYTVTMNGSSSGNVMSFAPFAAASFASFTISEVLYAQSAACRSGVAAAILINPSRIGDAPSSGIVQIELVYLFLYLCARAAVQTEV